VSTVSGFGEFAGKKYLNLESYRKSGAAVRTPVWFAADLSSHLDSPDAKLYIYTTGDSGKVKRIRNNDRVKIAPCNARGDLQGEWVEARAEIVTGNEAAHGMSLLNKKYMPWKQLLNFFAMFRPRDRVVFLIRPT
jgi:PPOX class probable F420-dependent enzyme